jgi:hypothetical protein
MVVWRVRIIDAASGKEIPVPSKELVDKQAKKEETARLSEGIKVQVHLSDGLVLSMHFGPHGAKPPYTDYFWTTSWVIPKNYPTGATSYRITAQWPEKNKRGEWIPFNTMPALTILAAGASQ